MTTGIPRQMRALKLWRRTGEALIADGFTVLEARSSGANHLLITVANTGWWRITDYGLRVRARTDSPHVAERVTA